MQITAPWKCPRNVWHVKKRVAGCHVTVPRRRHMGGRKSSRSRGSVTAVSCSMDSDDENVEEVVEGTWPLPFVPCTRERLHLHCGEGILSTLAEWCRFSLHKSSWVDLSAGLRGSSERQALCLTRRPAGQAREGGMWGISAPLPVWLLCLLSRAGSAEWHQMLLFVLVLRSLLRVFVFKLAPPSHAGSPLFRGWTEISRCRTKVVLSR